MTEKLIEFTGINRAISQQKAQDGSCQEIINARYRDGSWRPIGSKKVLYPPLVDQFTQIHIHDIEGGKYEGIPNWIGYKQNESKIYIINPADDTSTAIPNTNIGTDVSIVFLKRTMIVTSSNGVQVFLWDKEKATYIETASLPVPEVDLTRGTSSAYGTIEQGAHSSDAVRGEFFANLNKASTTSKGQVFGSLMYITAYRLFDGSYILPSVPRYLQVSNNGNLRWSNPGGDETDDSIFWLTFSAYALNASINNELYANVGQTKDLIESICVFATKAEHLHKIEADTLTDSILWTKYGTRYNSKHYIDTWPFKTVFTAINDKFTKLALSTSWYKIHEFSFEEVAGKTGRQTKEVDLNGYYQDYATRETLTTDQFTHHTLSAKAAFVYNDRLHLLNVKTNLASPYIVWPVSADLSTAVDYPGTISVSLKTALGNSVVRANVRIPVYAASSRITSEPFISYQQAELYLESLTGIIPNSAYIDDRGGYVDQSSGDYITEYIVVYHVAAGSGPQYILLPELIGYNDARAYNIQVTVNTGSGEVLVLSEALTKNTLMNFAFYHNKSFTADPLSTTSNYSAEKKLLSSFTFPATIPDESNVGYDTNRLQVSEIQNPLIFPAKNSYQIGTGDGITMAAASEPLSTGQFGQFPLQVFTTKGVWALEVGDGDILYSNVLPVSSEVIENRKNVISVGSGVVFSTVKGLFMLQGRQATKISELIKGIPLSDILGLTEIMTLIGQNPVISGDSFTPGLSNALSPVDFLTYIQNSEIGFDHDNRELIVTNPGYSYSYLYCFDTSMWIKISHSYRRLINNYPKLLGITNSSIVSISDEVENQAIEVMIISNALSFDARDVFKKVNRAILRAVVNTAIGKYAGFYIFASNDLKTWQLITGSQRSGNLKDFTIQRSHVSAKYFVFVVNGKVSCSSEINSIDLLFEPRWGNTIR